MKVPLEIWEEIQPGRKENDSFLDWISDPKNEEALLLAEDVDAGLVPTVVSDGYADDLTDDELEVVGRDPFLIAYALVDATGRRVVTSEVSKPSKQRQNRHLPDVCKTFGVSCCNPFEMNRALGFSTGWSR